MGVPNELEVQTVCKHCKRETKFYIQFNFGSAVEQTYKIGDSLDWSIPTEMGRPIEGRVLVEGFGHECTRCMKHPFETREFVVEIDRNKIVSATPNDGDFDFAGEEWVFADLGLS